jgi:zinc carboxypeptidase/N-acetylmuramoyl-L-alanine amidase-like protein
MREVREPMTFERRTMIALAALSLATVFALLASAAGASDRRITFGHSVDGRKLVAVRIGDPDAKRTGLVVGSIHGNETEGHEIVHTLRHDYRDAQHVKLWVVKTVNPDGAAANTRQNAHGVDLNRNFSYRWKGGVPKSSGYYPGPHPFSEPEARAVKRLVKRIRPNVTIWYHQPWGQVLLPCHGPAGVQRRYADLADWPTKRCRGQHLHGTATRWQNHHFRGRAFVVELNAGELPDSAARRHARAAVKVARSGAGKQAQSSAAASAAAERRSTLKRPRIKADPIPYGHKRKHQMARYSKRHYGQPRWHLRNPKVLVLHFTAGPSYQSAWQVFASNAPNRGELPGVCSHFVVDQDGRIYRTVRPSIRCRHTIGLNDTAIGVEMVQEAGSGSHWADQQILHRHAQIHAALRLIGWLKQREGIKMRNIIGHAMANNSPLFTDHEGWRNDHTDWLKRDVKKFRHRLRRMLSK